MEPARDAGHRPGQDERGQAGAGGGNREGRCRPHVVAHGEDAPARSPAAQPGQQQDRDGEQAEGQVGEGRLGGEVPTAHQHRAVDGERQPLLEAVRVERVGVGRRGEGERAHGQEGAADAQRGEADHDGHERSGQPRRGEGPEQVQVVAQHEVRRHHAADADDGELPEADLAAPARERDERHHDHRVDDARGEQEHVRRGQHDRGQEQHRGQHGERRPAEGPDEREGAGLGPDRARCHAATTQPRLPRLVAAQGPALEHEGRHDDHEEHDGGHRLGVDVPADELVHHAEADGGHEGRGQGPHPRDHRRRQRREEHHRRDPEVVRHALARRGEQHGDGSEHTGRRPHDGGEAGHRHGEQAGPVAILGGRPDGHTGVGPLQEPHEPEHRGRHHTDHQQLVAGEQDRPQPEVDVRQAGVEGADQRRGVEPTRQQQGDAAEQLGEADGGDGEREPRGRGEPTDHEQVDERTDGAAGQDPGEERRPPRPPRSEVERDPEGAGHAADRAVGEVHDAGGLVGEHEAECEQARRRTEDHALDRDPDRHGARRQAREHEQDDRDDRGRLQRRGTDGHESPHGKSWILPTDHWPTS